jgi:hypothetical protein
MLPGVTRVATSAEGVDCDFYCPIMSLAMELGTTSVEAIPANVPYLRADPADVEKWKTRVRAETAKLKVGLVWAGRPTPPGRSVPLLMFAALARDDVAFFSLQKGDAALDARHPPAGMRLIDCGAELRDFADTAALMSNHDLIISVDTAAAHLAGALGRPTWTLLPFAADWRWMIGREDSPWFPTMRLFRQRTRGQWGDVLERVAAELATLRTTY